MKSRPVQYLLTALAALFLSSLAVSCNAADVNVAKPAAIYLSLSAADLGTTEWAIRNGASEGNTWMRSHPVPKQLVVSAALTAADVALQRQGHRRGAKVLRVAVTVVRLGAVAVNLRNARRQR